MNRILISLLAVGAMALSAAAGDLRQLVTIPVNTLVVTNAVFASMPVRGNATAHLDAYSIGACATATQITVAVSAVSDSATNTITAVSAGAITANSTTQITGKTVVGTRDSFMVTLNATNTVPTYVLIDMQGY